MFSFFFDALAGAITASDDAFRPEAQTVRGRDGGRGRSEGFMAGYAGVDAWQRNHHGDNCRCYRCSGPTSPLGW